MAASAAGFAEREQKDGTRGVPGGSTAGRAESAKAHRLAELRAFLRSRRARISPAQAGLPDGGARRRTPGLRREEVAVLAGVGASWYQWLEQGRDISVSPQVLDAVARVLRLSSTEHRHLYVLAGLNPPPQQTESTDLQMCDGLRRLIDAWMPYPAYILDIYWNRVMHNDAAAAVLGIRPGLSENCLVTFFTDPVFRSRVHSWESNAAQLVAQYRAACSEHPGDEGFQEIAARTARLSPEFAELWERRDIAPGGQLTKELESPLVGTLHLEVTQLRVPARPDLSIVLQTPLPEADTAAKLEWLASPEGRRGSLYPVAG